MLGHVSTKLRLKTQFPSAKMFLCVISDKGVAAMKLIMLKNNSTIIDDFRNTRSNYLVFVVPLNQI